MKRPVRSPVQVVVGLGEKKTGYPINARKIQMIFPFIVQSDLLGPSGGWILGDG